MGLVFAHVPFLLMEVRAVVPGWSEAHGAVVGFGFGHGPCPLGVVGFGAWQQGTQQQQAQVWMPVVVQETARQMRLVAEGCWRGLGGRLGCSGRAKGTLRRVVRCYGVLWVCQVGLH